MTYEVKLSSQAAKFLKSQDKHIYDRLRKGLDKLKEPFIYVEHFEGNDYYKYRIGDYRALVDIDKERKLVFVRVLDKRGRIYEHHGK